jgi:crossover junction endodeoxyribonuclease RuvC
MGVDPGSSGAIAFYFPELPQKIAVVDVPLMNGEVDAAALADLIKGYKPIMAIIEHVGPMPKQGVSSTFKFGVAYGLVRGAVAALHIPMVLVTPQRWKKYFRLTAEKEQARALAIMTWPASEHFRLKKHHGRAEAALLAKYGAEAV